MRTITFSRPVAPLAIAATLLAAFVFLFAWPQSAAAHDPLVESSPAADSTVDTLPAELTLTFNAELIPGDGSTEIIVTDAAGQSVTDGEPELDGANVTQRLVAEASAGKYDVLWKVVSSDGHPTDGAFSFTVATSTLASEPSTAPTSAAPTAEASIAPTAEATAAPTADETQASPLPLWLILGGIAVLAVVVVIFLLLRPRKASGSDAPAER